MQHPPFQKDNYQLPQVSLLITQQQQMNSMGNPMTTSNQSAYSDYLNRNPYHPPTGQKNYNEQSKFGLFECLQASMGTLPQSSAGWLQTTQHSDGDPSLSGQGFPHQDQEPASELLTITVEIGNGEFENLVINEGDDPQDVAKQFCNKHQISGKLETLLADQIQHHIENAQTSTQQIEEEESQSQTSQTIQSNRGSTTRKSSKPTPEQLNQAIPYQQFYQQNPYMNHQQQQLPQEMTPYTETSQVNMNPDLDFSQYSAQQSQRSMMAMQPFDDPMQRLYAQMESPNYPLINSNSKRMVENKRKASGTVYDRLHSQAKAKQRVRARQDSQSHLEQQKHMSTSRLVKASSDFGDRLYQKGVKKKEEWDRVCKEIQLEREAQERDRYSFKPNINPNSLKFGKREDSYIKPEDKLIQYGKQVQEKLDKARTEQIFEDQNKFSFQPQINRKSEKLALERSHNSSTIYNQPAQQYPHYSQHQQQYAGNFYYEQENSCIKSNRSSSQNKFSELFEDAKRRQDRQEKIYAHMRDSECTFQPEIGANKYFVPSNMVSNGQDISIQSSVIDRLTSNRNTRSKSKDISQQNQNFDPHTGQQLFKPKTGRPPLSRKNQDGKSIGDHLYNQALISKEKQERAKIEAEANKQNTATTKHTQKQTDKIVESMKMVKFSEIFKALDSDEDNLISAQKIDISVLSPEILEIFTPLLCEMEEMAQTLNENEFIEASMRLYQTLTVPDKNKLISFKHKWDQKKEEHSQGPTFQPNLNENSLRLAQKNRPIGEDVADILIKKKQNYEQKIKDIQEMKKDEELAGCTFKPQTLMGSPYQYDQQNADINNMQFAPTQEFQYVDQENMQQPHFGQEMQGYQDQSQTSGTAGYEEVNSHNFYQFSPDQYMMSQQQYQQHFDEFQQYQQQYAQQQQLYNHGGVQ